MYETVVIDLSNYRFRDGEGRALSDPAIIHLVLVKKEWMNLFYKKKSFQRTLDVRETKTEAQ